MGKFNFLGFSEQDLEGIAQDLLNRALGLALEPFGLRDESMPNPDLWQGFRVQEKLELKGTRPKIIVEVKKVSSFRVNRVKPLVRELAEYYDYFKPNQLFLVLFSEISGTASMALTNELHKATEGKGEIFRLEWMEEVLLKNPDIQEKWGLLDTSPVNVSVTPELSEHLESLLEIVKIRGVYFFDTWRDSKKVKEVISSGEWKARTTLGKEVYRNVQTGDIIFLKSRPVSRDSETLDVRGVGRVRLVLHEGRFSVEWIALESISIKAPNDDISRSSIVKIDEKDLIQIFGQISGVLSDFPAIIQKLLGDGNRTNLSNENVLQLINQNLDKKEKFWWYNHNSSQITKEEISLYLNRKDTDILSADNGNLVFGFNDKTELESILSISGITRTDGLDKVVSYVTLSTEFKFEKPVSFDIINSKVGDKDLSEFRDEGLYILDTELSKKILEASGLINKSNSQGDASDKIPFHYDRVVDEDHLGREPVAEAFANLIREDIFTQNLDHAFMVHLQGEWGAGKSTFLNLIKKHLNSGNKKWVIINYNAWKNQHLIPPWWTLIDQIYHQTMKDQNFTSRCKLWWYEWKRRIIWYTGWQKILALFFTVIFISLLVLYANSILDFLTNKTLANTAIDNAEKGLTIGIFSKLFISFGSVIGLIFSLSKFLTTPFFMSSSKEASSFMERTADPLKRIKDHFKHLVSDINKNHQLAIFIDDIDRCDRTFLVELLEGIQTLFKEEKVLYIVSGDKQWISKAFQKQYEEFDTERKTDQHHLGDLFIRKAFQLSIRMPQVSETRKKHFWDHILGVTDFSDETSRSIEELGLAEKREFEREMASVSDDEIAKPEVLERIERQFKISADEVSKRAIKRKNASNNELRHLLQDFHRFLDANPRSIIRLANFYTMTRSTLIAERRDTRPNLLFRWLILKETYPSSLQLLKEVSDMENFVKKLNESDLSAETKSKCTLLINGDEGKDGLSMEIIKDLEGM